MNRLLQKRGRSLEDLFFHKHNQALVRQWRHEAEQQAKETALQKKKAELTAVTGVTDDALLDDLIRLGIEPATIMAFGLLPLIEVAWADLEIQNAERDVLLRAAEEQGIARDSLAFQILGEWLTRRPPRALLQAWILYMRTLCAALDERRRNALRNSLLGRARAVAEAAGGFLGWGRKVSDAEAEVLAKLETAFREPPPLAC